MLYPKNIDWKKVWNKKSKIKNPKKLKDLLALNGYNSHTSSINLSEWIKYTNFFIQKYKINSSNKILDIGCGSGAFLIPFYKNGIRCFGIDYSSELIKHCKKNMPKGKFVVSEASDLKKFKKISFDYIFVNSIFQYFKNIQYAKKVLKEIISISDKNTKIFLLDIPDQIKYQLWKKFIVNKIGLEGFNSNYSILKHQFYNKKMFKKFFISKNFKIKIIDQKLIKKVNSKYRFNIFLEK